MSRCRLALPLMLLIAFISPLFSGGLLPAVLAQDITPDPGSTATHVQEVLESVQLASPSKPLDLKPLKELRVAIVRQAQLHGGYYGAGFSPVRDQLEPLRPLAKQLAESEHSEERYYSAVLNSCLRQTEETRALLFKLADDEQRETAGTALDALFGLKLDTPELREKLVQALQEDTPPRERSTLHGLAITNVGAWGIIEALPVLIQKLAASSDGSGPVDRNIVRQIKALGPQAADALPLLRQLSEKRRAAGNADFRELEDLDHALSVISGQHKAPQSLPAQTSSSPKPGPPLPDQSRFGKTSPTAVREEQDSSSWWLTVLVITPAVIALLWIFLKKRR